MKIISHREKVVAQRDKTTLVRPLFVYVFFRNFYDYCYYRHSSTGTADWNWFSSSSSFSISRSLALVDSCMLLLFGVHTRSDPKNNSTRTHISNIFLWTKHAQYLKHADTRANMHTQQRTQCSTLPHTEQRSREHRQDKAKNACSLY